MGDMQIYSTPFVAEECIGRPGLLAPFKGHMNSAISFWFPVSQETFKSVYCLVGESVWSKLSVGLSEPTLYFESGNWIATSPLTNRPYAFTFIGSDFSVKLSNPSFRKKLYLGASVCLFK